MPFLEVTLQTWIKDLKRRKMEIMSDVTEHPMVSFYFIILYI